MNPRWIADVWSGPRRTGAFQVSGIRQDGSVETQGLDAGAARRGLDELFRRALRRGGKAPMADRDARLASDPLSSPESQKKDVVVYPDDVYISGLPMIDQGRTAYCAVASAARVLQGYGIDVSMEDLAALANSSVSGGTDLRNWEHAINSVAREHGLKLKVLGELTETKTPLDRLLYEYNGVARTLGYEALDVNKYATWWKSDYMSFAADREYEVQREVMLSNDVKGQAFSDNVIARVDDSDPLFWSVTLGDVPEQTFYGESTQLKDGRGAHMRLIIGYNEKRGEVLYSDSWGEGHELKRMDAADALSITRAVSYLTDIK